ncbi:peptidase S8/S53 domain-containing protein [Ilyonectria robusta]|uniref:peptidase S8/S53 domain-containing protein n=1 Tax=Ilyonectria robusta TaxID=1079257 RepID=UPI001E8DD899|nr:peptidase S8/S53 domain-containing protein [Ilyonectria robusta]KAH8734200.1 peptidase S8/S53 domain-containing protein [Ilyonectria robusta]
MVSQNATGEQIRDIRTILLKFANADSVSENISGRTGLVAFWTAEITLAEVETLRATPGVSPKYIFSMPKLTKHSFPPMGTSNERRITARKPKSARLQGDAVDELKMVSQPRGEKLSNLAGYGYASEGGKGITIYIIDTGANAQHSEWLGMSGNKRFMFPITAPVHSDPKDHGSCIASKAAGPKYGAAKNANVVMIPLSENRKVTDMVPALIKALTAVEEDVIKKGLKGKAVVNMSFEMSKWIYQMQIVQDYKKKVASLLKNDIVLVACSGNFRVLDEQIDRYPALFGKDLDLVVVGAVDKDGKRTQYSQGSEDQLTVSAPGDVLCASGKDNTVAQKSGTSFATATISGVIAVFLSQPEYKAKLQKRGKVAANVKSLLKAMAYPRVKDEPAVVWNGVDPRSLASVWPTAAIGKL